MGGRMGEHRDSFLIRAGKRARAERGLLGGVLAEYQARADIDDATLATELGLDLEGLARLSLCRPPRPDRFAADVDAIAARTGADALRLAGLIRLAQSLGALTEAAPLDEGLRAARRSKDPGESRAEEGEES